MQCQDRWKFSQELGKFREATAARIYELHKVPLSVGRLRGWLSLFKPSLSECPPESARSTVPTDVSSCHCFSLAVVCVVRDWKNI